MLDSLNTPSFVAGQNAANAAVCDNNAVVGENLSPRHHGNNPFRMDDKISAGSLLDCKFNL